MLVISNRPPLRARPILKLLTRLLPELYSTRSNYYYKSHSTRLQSFSKNRSNVHIGQIKRSLVKRKFKMLGMVQKKTESSHLNLLNGCKKVVSISIIHASRNIFNMFNSFAVFVQTETNFSCCCVNEER